jgi:CIC family chloride channel protein
VLTVTPSDDLHAALGRLTELNVDEIPVVAPNDPTRLIGLLHRRELVSAYSQQIQSLRSPAPAGGNVPEPGESAEKAPAGAGAS